MADERAGQEQGEGTAEVKDGLERRNGLLVAMIHQGKRYELPGTNDEDFREIERHLLENRINPLLAIKDELEAVRDNPQLMEMLVDRAYRDIRKTASVDQVSQAEVRDYLDTRDGTIHAIWLMIRRKHPEVTLEQARTMFADVSTAEAQKRMDEASEKSLARRAPRTFASGPRQVAAQGREDPPGGHPSRAAPTQDPGEDPQDGQEGQDDALARRVDATEE